LGTIHVATPNRSPQLNLPANRGIHFRGRPFALLLALAPFATIILLGSQLYFRHDDSALLLWAKEFDSPFYYALSTDPDTNRFASYPGMGGYWRPGSYLYVLLLWSIFGAVPWPYFVIGGLVFLAAVFCFFRMAEQYAGTASALLSCWILFVAFGGSFYSLFHVTVPIYFFWQVAMIYSFWAYLRFGRRAYLIAMLLLLVPSVGRQTTPFLLSAILIAAWLEHARPPWSFFREKLPAFVVVAVAFWLLTLSEGTVHGSIAQHVDDAGAAWAFASERIHFYGDRLTRGIPGVLLLGLVGGTAVQRLAGAVAERTRFKVSPPGWLALVALGTAALWGHTSASVLWLVIACCSLVVTDRRLRLPILWAGVSLGCFIAVDYYHEGYLLEAGFPLSLALGIVLDRLRVAAAERWSITARAYRLRWLVGAACVVVLILPFGFGALRKGTSVAVEIVSTAIATNRNFAQLMSAMATELPTGAEVYEIDEAALGMTRFDRRHLTVRERAARVKVMGIEDTRVMLRVLGRSDIRMRALPMDESEPPRDGSYLVGLNNFEVQDLQESYGVAVVREYCQYGECAGIYRLSSK
jgi:hypothetical protein